jgi:DNA-binding beta-propeller fold protein YncE
VEASTGTITTVIGTGATGTVSADGTAAAAARIGHPAGLFFDAQGALHFLTVQDWSSDLNALLKVDAMGNLRSVAGRAVNTALTLTNTTLYRPFGVAVDAVGNRYISDGEHDRILRLDVSGSVTVVAGNGIRGFGGDGGPATQAMLAGPQGLWLDNSGNLYFADSNNHRIRRRRQHARRLSRRLAHQPPARRRPGLQLHRR